MLGLGFRLQDVESPGFGCRGFGLVFGSTQRPLSSSFWGFLFLIL